MNFTPVSAALGGVLIGLSAVLMMATMGRIAGVSGFVSRLLPPYEDLDWPIRAAFVAGLIAAPWLYRWSGMHVEINQPASIMALVIAGVLVGFGAVYGSGCTSGHGVCGIARVSPRSIIATSVFMVSGMATVFVIRHVIGG
jgi:uncharacterized membrane protein YedE/YeeE